MKLFWLACHAQGRSGKAVHECIRIYIKIIWDMALRMKESNGRARRETGQHARKVEVRKDSSGTEDQAKRKDLLLMSAGFLALPCMEAAASKQGCETASG